MSIVTFAELQRIMVFRDFSEEGLHRLLQQSEVRSYEQGGTVCKRRQAPEGYVFLIRGSLMIHNNLFKSSLMRSSDKACCFSIDETLRNASVVIAQEDSVLLMINPKELDLIHAWEHKLPTEQGGIAVAEIEEQEDDNWMSAFLSSPLFMKIPPVNIQKLFAAFANVEVKKGEEIIRFNRPGDFFYVIESGEAEVELPNGKVTQQPIILKSGDYFGEGALVGDAMHSATVKMASDGVLARLSKKDFMELLQQPLQRYLGQEELGQLIAEGKTVIPLDVRMAFECRDNEGVKNIPLGKLRDRLDSLEAGATYVLTPSEDKRSLVALQLLVEEGYDAWLLR